METAQVPPPRTGTAEVSGKRLLRTTLIVALVVLASGTLLWQLFGTANIFPTQAAASAAPAKPAVAAPGARSPAQAASQPVPDAPRYGTGLNLVPPPYRSWQVAPQPLPVNKPEPAPGKPAADATPAAPAARDALPMQTSVVGGKPPRVGIAAHPAGVTSGSGSSTRPGGTADPNG